MDHHEAHTPAQPGTEAPTDAHSMHHGHPGKQAQPDPAPPSHRVIRPQDSHLAAGAGHQGHVDHTGHETTFRRRFWVSLSLSLPVILCSQMIQEWFSFRPPAFPGRLWVTPLFSTIVFVYGGLPFLRMALPELRTRKPGMMTLISLAFSVAFVYSFAALAIPAGEAFFRELVT